MNNAKRRTAETSYDAALSAFKVISAHYRAITIRYRAREISDEEFLAARRDLDAAQAVCDAAETAFITDCNAR